MGIFKYVKAAFANRWNLLALFGGVGFSFVSGSPEVGLPLVAAAELAWLGFGGTHPGFHRYIDIQEHQERSKEAAKDTAARMRSMLNSLPRGARKRFENLRKECQRLQTIADQYQSAHGEDRDEQLAELRSDGLDRLLWLYLKLLYSEHSLNQFFETTSREQIQSELDDATERHEAESKKAPDQQRERIIQTLQDSMRTSEERLQNFLNAKDSYELLRAEQLRLESRIRSMAEIGISRGDPEMMSAQVDSVADSVIETEKTLSGLKFVTGFTEEDEFAPEIVSRRTIRQR